MFGSKIPDRIPYGFPTDFWARFGCGPTVITERLIWTTTGMRRISAPDRLLTQSCRDCDLRRFLPAVQPAPAVAMLGLNPQGFMKSGFNKSPGVTQGAGVMAFGFAARRHMRFAITL